MVSKLYVIVCTYYFYPASSYIHTFNLMKEFAKKSVDVHCTLMQDAINQSQKLDFFSEPFF